MDLLSAATSEMAHELLARGLSFRFVARGASMRPFVRDGDLLVVAPEGERALVGDLVLIPEGEFTVHRVIARLGHRIWVKGDAMPRIDGVFDRRTIAGRVVELSRAGRLIPHRRRRAIPMSLLGGLARRLAGRA